MRSSRIKKHVFSAVVLLVLSCISMSVANNEVAAPKEQTTKAMQSQDTTRPWWIGGLLTLLGIVVGVCIIVYQLGRQHKNELKLQEENYRQKLRLGIYQEFSKVLEEANDKTSEVGMYAFLIPINVKIYRDQIKSGLAPAPIKHRAIEFSNKHQEVSDSIIKLIRLFEKYEIISPELDIFKLAVIVATHDMREALKPLHSYLLQILPMDVVDKTGNIQVVNVISPTNEQIDRLDGLVNTYKNADDDLSGYLFDLNVELQNIFLSRLFNNKVQRRQPLDPNVKVITTDPEDMTKLRKYFEEETDWGKQEKQVEEQVKAKF